MDMGMDMDGGMDMSADQPPPTDDEYPPSYFSHSEHRAVLFTHIALMVLGWVVILPLGESDGCGKVLGALVASGRSGLT